MRRIVTAMAVVALTLAVGAPPGWAQDASQPSNVAVAVNTQDGRSVFKIAFSVRTMRGDTVSPTNAAVASSSCTDCQTVAVAIQIVLATGDTDVVSPTNLAIALNDTCSSGETMASAFQYVFATGDATRFSSDAHRRLAGTRLRLQQLRQASETMTLEQIAAELQAISDEIADVLATELEPAPDAPPADAGTTTTSTTAASTTAPTDSTPSDTEPSPQTVPEGSTTTTSAEPNPSTAETTSTTAAG